MMTALKGQKRKVGGNRLYLDLVGTPVYIKSFTVF